MMAVRATAQPVPVIGPCIHRWARRHDDRGHIIYHCTQPGCTAQVDWTSARDEYEHLLRTPQPLAPGGQ